MSWQDPVALVLGALLVVGAFALRRRLSRSHCASCGTNESAPPRPTRVAVETLRLNRRR